MTLALNFDVIHHHSKLSTANLGYDLRSSFIDVVRNSFVVFYLLLENLFIKKTPITIPNNCRTLKFILNLSYLSSEFITWSSWIFTIKEYFAEVVDIYTANYMSIILDLLSNMLSREGNKTCRIIPMCWSTINKVIMIIEHASGNQNSKHRNSQLDGDYRNLLQIRRCYIEKNNKICDKYFLF